MSARAFTLDASQLADLLQHRTNAALVATTTDGLVAYWNRGAEALFGRSAQEVIGSPVADATGADGVVCQCVIRLDSTPELHVIIYGSDASDDGRGRTAVLTPRQRHILDLIAQGLSTRDIARKIGRSTKTVEAHRANLMKRLGERNLAGLIRLALSEGLGTHHR